MWRVSKNCRRMLLATVRIVKNAWPTTVIVLARAHSGWGITGAGGVLGLFRGIIPILMGEVNEADLHSYRRRPSSRPAYI
jgi:hypothetical protein